MPMPDAPPVTTTPALRRLGYVANEGAEEGVILSARRQSGLRALPHHRQVALDGGVPDDEGMRISRLPFGERRQLRRRTVLTRMVRDLHVRATLRDRLAEVTRRAGIDVKPI